MTRSEEESLFLSLLSQLQSPDPALVFAALQMIKHRLIGHDQTKELLVRLRIASALTSILQKDENLDKTWLDAKVEAGIVVGSLAYAGESYVVHLLSSAALPPLAASLNPDKSPPKLVLSSLRTLNTMLDTYISPSALSNPAVAISSALYTPDGLRNIHKILSQSSSDRLSQDQVSLAASLIAKSCGRVPHTAGGEPEEGVAQREGLHQKLLVGAGVLDVLTTRLASFAPDEYRKRRTNDSKAPSQAPPNARLAPILDAIATIIRGSRLRSIEFLFSPAIISLFPYTASDDLKAATRLEDTAKSLHLPQLKSSSNIIRPPRKITNSSAFPPLPTAASSSLSAQFPPLSASSHAMGFPALHHYSNTHPSHHHHTDERAEDDSESSTGGDTPLRRRADTADIDEEERLRPVVGIHSTADNTDPALDIADSELINWLISLIRSGDPITRLTAGSLLTNLFLAGLVSKKLTSFIALLVVPILVRLLDENGRVIRFGSTGMGGIDTQTWNRWEVEERAPTVLSRLVIENLEFQKAAVDAGAIKKLAMILKRASEPLSSAVNGANGNATHASVGEPMSKSNPEYNHRMKVKEGVLRSLANLGLFKDEYRKKIIDAGVLQTVVSTCLKPLMPIQSSLPPDNTTTEGNPPSVLVAACGVIRSVSRSVSILRTSLIDAAVAIPMFSLLRHENDDVKIAATAAVCNLVLDFSPMRKPISEAGALEVLCDLVKGSNGQLRLNALWAIKHLMLEADAVVKRRSLESLGVEYLMSIISAVTPDPSAEPMSDEDEEMADEPVEDGGRLRSSEFLDQRLPAKIRAAVKHLQKQERTAQAVQSRKEAIALQEQGLQFIRNLICGSEVGSMIDLVFSSVGADRLLSLYETLLTTPNQPSEIVNAVVYNIVHIAAGAPRHRQSIIERTELLRVLLGFWNHPNPHVRSGLAWVVINLTWKEEGVEAGGVQRRILVLRGLGWVEKLKEMKKDTELDVKERVKTAEFQLSGVSGNNGSNIGAVAGGSGPGR